jgi:hypothetical protein
MVTHLYIQMIFIEKLRPSMIDLASSKLNPEISLLYDTWAE